jgi:1-deoxy-D-xylulose-5-phosphate synthase
VEDNKMAVALSLKEQAFFLRQEIIDVVSKNGGHLGASLGATDLILALHQVFNSPIDKLLFDTGHQTYAHKLLTGRKDRFHTLRTHQGLCGFTDPSESSHDHFFAGHAGTALSLALGVHDASVFSDNRPWVIAVIGDASLSCGLTLEAFNNISPKQDRLIIVLNDNGMSISKGCGNFHEYLQKIGTFPPMSLRENFTDIFSIFNCKYLGPIDGHDPDQLVKLFSGLKSGKGPFIVHAKTIKGYGLEYAENSPTVWHGPKPFCIESGTFKQKSSTLTPFPKIFGKTLIEMQKNHQDLQVITPATATGASLEEFAALHPLNFHDVGIAEGHAITYAAGLARFKNSKVIASIYATFLHRALDNLFHDVILQNIPLILAIDPQDGSTHHGIYDIGFLKTMPGLTIAQPRNGKILQELLHSALAYTSPIAIRYPNLDTHTGEGGSVYREPGVGDLLAKTAALSKKILLVSLGHMADVAFLVRNKLLEIGLDATIFDPVFIKPLDHKQLHGLISEHDYLFILEEHAEKSGLGSIILSFINENQLFNKKVKIFGIPDRFFAHGTYKELIEEIGLSDNQIFDKIVEFLDTPL